MNVNLYNIFISKISDLFKIENETWPSYCGYIYVPVSRNYYATITNIHKIQCVSIIIELLSNAIKTENYRIYAKCIDRNNCHAYIIKLKIL